MPKLHTIVNKEQTCNKIMKPNNPSYLLSFFGLSIATSPFVIGILVFYLLSEFMTELGKASEEIFRSQRLPILNFSDFEQK